MPNKPKIEISLIYIAIPVEPPPGFASRNDPAKDTNIRLELQRNRCRVWDSVSGTNSVGDYRYDQEEPTTPWDLGRNQLVDIGYFDTVYRYLLAQRIANRNNLLGEFIGYTVDAMDAAISNRDGSMVYFAQAGDRIKIGWSRKVSARICQLQTGNPDPVRLLATTPGGRALERQLHERFADARVSGEWFTATPDLVAYIESLN